MFFFSKKMKSDFNIMDNFMWLREINRVNKNQFFFLTTKLSIRVNRTWNLTFLKHLIVLFLCQAIFFSWNITFLFFFLKKKTKKKRSYLKNESSSRWYSKFYQDRCPYYVAIVTVNELNYWIIKLSQLGLGFITKSLLFIAINQ